MNKILCTSFLLLLFIRVSGQNLITGMEYWYDTTYSAHISQSTIPLQEVLISTSLNTSGLSKGLHTFNFRFQQSSGYWSQTTTTYFLKTGESQTPSPLINAYRYWVGGVDSVVTVNVIPSVNPHNLVATLDLSWIHKGNNYLYMQFRDEQDNWSVASVDSFYKAGIPVAAFSTVDTLLCSRDSVHFINNSSDADIYLWHFGDGDSSIEAEPVHKYDLPGDYSVSLTARDTVDGIDSTIIFTGYIHVMPGAIPSFTFNQSFLQVTFTNTSQNAFAYYWQFGDSAHSINTDPVHTYLHDGNYTVILTATDSCGSVSDTQSVSLVLNTENVFSSKSFSVIQNNNEVKITFHENCNRCSYFLLDASGRLINSDLFENFGAEKSKNLSIEGLPAGIYILRLSNEKYCRSELIYKLY